MPLTLKTGVERVCKPGSQPVLGPPTSRISLRSVTSLSSVATASRIRTERPRRWPTAGQPRRRRPMTTHGSALWVEVSISVIQP